MSTEIDNLQRLADGWLGLWQLDASEGVMLWCDGIGTPVDDMDPDAAVTLVALLNAIRPALAEFRSEIARLTAELAAARAVPADVEAAIETTIRHVSDAGYAIAKGHAYMLDGDQRIATRRLSEVVARAIANAKGEAVAGFIDGHAKRIAGEAGMPCADGDEQTAWSAEVHDVLNHLRIDEDGAVRDGRATQAPPTVRRVGEALATEPVGTIVAMDGVGKYRDVQYRLVEGPRPRPRARVWSGYQWGAWEQTMLIGHYLMEPCRLVPAHLADDPPESRGPIGGEKGGE